MRGWGAAGWQAQRRAERVVVGIEEGQGESAGAEESRSVSVCGERGAQSGSGRRRVHTRRGKQALHN